MNEGMNERINQIIVYIIITAWAALVFYLMSFSRQEDIFRGISIGFGLFALGLMLKFAYLRGKSKK
jgi:hypothetical protein